MSDLGLCLHLMMTHAVMYVHLTSSAANFSRLLLRVSISRMAVSVLDGADER